MRDVRPILVGCMALIVGGGVALAVHDGSRVKSLDEPAFLDLSGNLAFHSAFAHTNAPAIEGYDPRLPPGALRATAYRAPGYVWLQAPFRLAGGGLVLLRAVNFVLFALTLWISSSLLIKTAGPAAALSGIAMILAYPVLFYTAGTLYPQTFAAFLLLAGVVQLERLGSSSPLSQFCLTGLIWALLALTVPICLALVPIAAGWLLWSRRANVRQVAATGAVVVLAVALWGARNSVVLGERTGVSTSFGFNLLAGNGPYARYDRGAGDLRWPKGVREQVLNKSEVERDRILTRAALDWMRENPSQAAVLYAQKLLYWFSFRNRIVSDDLVEGGSGAGPPLLRDLVMLIGYGLLVVIAAVRMALVRRFPLSALEMLLLALYLAAGAAYAVFFSRIRFRLPFDWLLIAADATFVGRLLRSPVLERPDDRGGAAPA